jgi:hypothetical protein
MVRRLALLVVAVTVGLYIQLPPVHAQTSNCCKNVKTTPPPQWQKVGDSRHGLTDTVICNTALWDVTWETENRVSPSCRHGDTCANGHGWWQKGGKYGNSCPDYCDYCMCIVHAVCVPSQRFTYVMTSCPHAAKCPVCGLPPTP